MVESTTARFNGLNAPADHFHDSAPDEQARYIARLPVVEAAGLARRMSAQALARAARHLDRAVYRSIERRLPVERRRRVRRLLALPVKSVGAWQHDEFPVVTAGVPAAVALRPWFGGGAGTLYVVAGDGAYLGTVAAERLAGDSAQGPVEGLIERMMPVNELDECGRVARRMRRHGVSELPVVDGAGRLTGVVRFNDIAGCGLLTRMAVAAGGWYVTGTGAPGGATLTGVVAAAAVITAALIW